MLDKLIDRVGDWNPQLFKELKMRFGGNTLTIFMVGVIFIQIVVAIFFSYAITSFTGRIRAGFDLLNWLVPMSLILGGVYTIVSDLSQEEKRGTLNFIRLTPQSARSIFLCKILGVPSLIYLCVLLVFPLHLIVGMFAGVNFVLMLAWYCTIAIITYLCLSLAILYSLHGAKYAILLTIFCAVPVKAMISLYNYYLNSVIAKGSATDPEVVSISWFYIPIANHILLLDSFIICTFLSIGYWVWVTIDRKYVNPTSTAFKKEDSYWMNVQVQIWLLGLALSLVNEVNIDRASDRFYVLAIFYTISAMWVYSIVPLILPNKWSMAEWNRNLDRDVKHEHLHWWEQDIIQDLLWHDRSPIVLAMLVNLLIPASIWGLCFAIFIRDGELLIKSICGIGIVSILTLIHIIVINFIGWRSTDNKISLIPLFLLMSFLPLFLGFIVATNPDSKNIALNFILFSPLSWFGVTQVSIANIGMIIMGQLGMLAGLTKLFHQRLQKLAAAEHQIINRQKSLLGRTNI